MSTAPDEMDTMMKDATATNDRGALIERAARWLADRPRTRLPVAAVIDEFELSVSEACQAAAMASRMRMYRAANG